jgi:hypothetical protein
MLVAATTDAVNTAAILPADDDNPLIEALNVVPGNDGDGVPYPDPLNTKLND